MGNGSSSYYNNSSVSASSYLDGNWHHAVLVINGTSIKLYVNNTLVGDLTSSVSAGTAATNYFSIGQGYDSASGSSNYFNGKIDQLRIYEGTLEEYQVNELYNETASQNDDIELGGPPEILVSANANAGFSIVKYTGSTVTQKIPHGLSAVPNMIIAKNISANGHSWTVFHSSLGAGKILRLESTGAVITNDSFWGGTSNAPNATTFTVADNNDNNSQSGSASTIIAYCFHSVSGYSKFGSYSGNGTTQTITTGFQPDFVMIKAYTNSTSLTSWTIIDSVRYGSSSDTNPIYANLSAAEGTRGNGSGDGDVLETSFTSTGFKLGDTGSDNGSDEMNDPNNDYIYMAFKIN
jgi:hypothetical protein